MLDALGGQDAMNRESTTAVNKPHRHTLVAGLAALLVFCVSPARADEFVVEVRTIPELKAVFGRVESRDVVAELIDDIGEWHG